MSERSGLAVALLAAGSSRRFGEQDKLAAEFRGSPLGLHSARLIPREVFEFAYVIARNIDHPCAEGWREAGFDVHANPNAEEGMGSSAAYAAQLAIGDGARALMILLADMPLVPTEHFSALISAGLDLGAQGLAVSGFGQRRSPPAVFGAAHFPSLADLSGDKGARGLIAQGHLVPIEERLLIDIDTPGMLAEFR